MQTTDDAKNSANEEDIIKNSEEQDIFNNIEYICQFTDLITESLQKGFDIAQLPNGDVIVTEIRRINVQYRWDKQKRKIIKLCQT